MPMSRERFEALADAYGGDVARWPATEREAAAALMVEDAAFARGVLAEASRLDAALDEWRPLAVTPALRQAALAATPKARRRGVLATWGVRVGLGAGLAAACAMGVLVGALSFGDGAASATADAVTAAMTPYEGPGDDGAATGDV
jgi:hypothetical protein